MAPRQKITTGPNDRPIDETIGQTGEGLPDDSGRSPRTDEAQVARARRSLTGEAEQAGPETGKPKNPDAVRAGTPGAGENVCRRCAGSGRLDGMKCPDCGGSGKVTTPVGGG